MSNIHFLMRNIHFLTLKRLVFFSTNYVKFKQVRTCSNQIRTDLFEIDGGLKETFRKHIVLKQLLRACVNSSSADTAFSKMQPVATAGLIMGSPQPVLRDGWSAATLLGGIGQMDADCLQAIKQELPDDPDELKALQQAS